MSYDEFYNSTPRQFNNRYRGWEEIETKHHRTTWEQTRFIAYFNILPHVEKGKDFKETDLARFPWERSSENKKLLTREELLQKAIGKGMKLSSKLSNLIKDA